MRNTFWISHKLRGCMQELMKCDGGRVICANYYNIDCLMTASKNLNKYLQAPNEINSAYRGQCCKYVPVITAL